MNIPLETEIIEPTSNIINKGTGAGGANTNVNGLSYEEKTDLKTEYSNCVINEKYHTKKISFHLFINVEFVNANKKAFHKYMESMGEKNASIQPAAGCKEPDEAYIDENRKYIYIIEKKFQKGTGSVDEKIQTGPFKQQHYRKMFPNFKTFYIYCLSDWFKRKEYESVLEYLQENNIPIFWGNEIDYKSKIIHFISNSL